VSRGRYQLTDSTPALNHEAFRAVWVFKREMESFEDSDTHTATHTLQREREMESFEDLDTHTATHTLQREREMESFADSDRDF